jgi:hypothetical protein
LRVGQPELEAVVVVVDNVEQRGEPAVVEEAAGLMAPQSAERRRPISVVGRARGLEVVDESSNTWSDASFEVMRSSSSGREM